MEVQDIVMLWISCMVDIYFIYMFFSSLFEKRSWASQSLYKKYAFMFAAILSTFMVNYFGNGDLNLCIVPIVYCIFLGLLFEYKIGNFIICFIVAFSIIVGCECMFAAILGMSNHAYKSLSDMPLQIFGVKLLTYIIFIIVQQIIGKKNRKMDNWLFVKYLFIPVSGLGMMLGIFYSGAYIEQETRWKVSMILCFALMLVGNILVFYAFQKYAENMQKTMEQNVLLTKQEADLCFYKQIMQVHDAHNEMVHNTKHYLGMIGQLIAKKEYDTVSKLLCDLGNQIDENEMIVYSEENHILNAVLSEKRGQALKANVKFDAYVEPGIVLDGISDADLIAMLENLLDNALRASTNCEENRFIKIRVFMQEIGGFCVIKIVNPFEGDLIMEGEDFVTTKSEHGMHGIGIKSVNRMAEKYGGYLDCKVETHLFEAVLLLSVVGE